MDTRTLDQSVQQLQANKDAWARLPAARKGEYLDAIMRGYAAVAERLVAACNAAKGVEAGTPRAGEEWAHPYQTMRLLRLLRETLRRIAVRGRIAPPPGALRALPDGRLAVKVFPLSGPDRLLHQGSRAEIWMRPGVTRENVEENTAGFYRRPAAAGKVALVLGAGNVSSVGPGDLLQKLFAEGQVCLYKHNPAADYLAPFLEEAFGDLVHDGFLRFASGGADVGEYLAQHPGVDELHLTGSDRTYEAIVFGRGEEGRRRKQAGEPRLRKRFTCELGNASPVIVAPGVWSESDIQFHAENIATQMTNNCGLNCLSARVLILPRKWPQAERLMDALRALLSASPARQAYYPGMEERYGEVLAANPRAEPAGPRSPGVLPYTLVPGLDPDDKDNPCFASECFMPLLAQTSLPGADAAEFLDHAADFVNRTLWGTLSASLIVHPETERQLGGAIEETIARMRYGTVSLNLWTALGYLWGTPTWGAWPGHTAADIQSGCGVVHNSFLFDQPEKSVIYGPFRIWPKPAWFITNRRMHRILPRLFELERAPSLGRALRIAFTALRG